MAEATAAHPLFDMVNPRGYAGPPPNDPDILSYRHRRAPAEGEPDPADDAPTVVRVELAFDWRALWRGLRRGRVRWVRVQWELRSSHEG